MLTAYQSQEPLLHSVSTLIPTGHKDFVPHVVGLLKIVRDFILSDPDPDLVIPKDLDPFVYLYAQQAASRLSPAVLYGNRNVPVDFVYSMQEFLNVFPHEKVIEKKSKMKNK